MDKKRGPVSPIVGYPLGLGIWILAFVAGNLLGRIAASLNGWHELSYDEPGAVIWSAVQGAAGAYLAILGAKVWLGDSNYARFWLFLLVYGSAFIIAALVIYSIYVGNFDGMGWSLLSTISALLATEFVRRLDDKEFG